ncbi:MAG: hypothetical protein SGPRY_014651 [Prymnesium sp.]
MLSLLRVSPAEQRWFSLDLLTSLLTSLSLNSLSISPLSSFADYLTASRSLRRADGGATLRWLEAHSKQLREQMGGRGEGLNEDETCTCAYGVRGGGVFKLQSKINHSCEPNAQVVCAFTCAAIDVVCTRAIRVGEEVTICYVDPTLEVGRRRQALRAAYGFECTCARCKREQGSHRDDTKQLSAH